MRRCPTKKPVAMKRGGSASVKNPVAKAVKKIKPSIVKPKKGKGSYNRKASSFSSGGAAKVRSAGKDYMAGIRKRTPATGVKAKSRQQAMKEKIQKDANKSRRGFDSTPRQLEELKSGGNVKKKVGKVVKALKKASKSHAGQAKTLSALKLREGGSTTKRKPKVKTPKGTKGFKGIQPLKPTRMRANRYESGGKTDKAKRGKVDQYKTTSPRYSGLKRGSIMQRAMTKGKGSSYRDQGTFTSASPAEAREEKARERSKQKSKKIIGDNPLKTPNAPIKKEQSKDAKRVADIKRRQKTASAVRKKKSEISRKGRGLSLIHI